MLTYVKKPPLNKKIGPTEEFFPIDYIEDLQNAASIMDIFKSSANGSRPASVILTSAHQSAGEAAPAPSSPLAPPSAYSSPAESRSPSARRLRCCSGRLCALLVLLSCLVLATAALSAATFYLTELHADEVAALREQVQAQGAVLQRLRSLAAHHAASRAALVSPASGIRSETETAKHKAHTLGQNPRPSSGGR